MISNIDQIPVDAVRAAALRCDVVDAVESLQRDLDAEIAARSPTCWNKGECCRFGEYGHRLYVTTLEVAYYLAREPSPSEAVCSTPSSQPTGLPSLAILDTSSEDKRDASEGPADVCPHAHAGRCHARERRPLGCRIFYCDPAAQEWQGPMTERYLTRLRALHEQFEVPYVYADWMAFLRALGCV